MRLLLASIFALLLAPHARADAKVYKWIDELGVTHFSTTAPTRDAKPAKLPEINRGEVKIPELKVSTCDSHGGINCQAGADTDGSVICVDGFKDVTPRFRFSCASPKLQISDISDLDDAGGFTVFIRNAKSVAAEKVAVLYKPDNARPVKLEGPESVEAFGVAEYSFKRPLTAEARDTLPVKPGLGDVEINCANCS